MPSKKKTPLKKAAKKTAAKKTASKKAPAKKVAQKTAAKKVVKTTPAKKSAPSKKTAAKKLVKKAPAKKPTPVKEKRTAEKPTSAKAPPALKKAVVSREGAAADKKSTPIVFSLDDIEELMASKKNKSSSEKKELEPKETAAKKSPAKKVVVEDKPVEKRVLGAASLADILGFNPAEKKKSTELGNSEVPKKWKKYYNLLIELRAHVSDEIDLHTSDTLKHSSREDSCDLSGYAIHPADSGTDSFDRDFALSLVSSEQDALIEIEEAILRIKNGNYGTCEITGKSIPAARLTAVPFARYSVEGQAEQERNQHRKHNRAAAGGIFGDMTDTPKLESSDDDE